MKGASPFEPNKLILDAEARMCEQVDTPFLANLRRNRSTCSSFPWP